ncbi:MAG: hypothetical protein IJ880_15585 [Bacilli bacterium]|nr:hypothetical protein [Bacilli bacterium]
MFDKKYKIKLDIVDLRITIRAINELRNSLIEQGNYNGSLDELLMKYINVLEK